MNRSVGVFQRPIREGETVDYLVREYIANGKIFAKTEFGIDSTPFLDRGKKPRPKSPVVKGSLVTLDESLRLKVISQEGNLRIQLDTPAGSDLYTKLSEVYKGQGFEEI